MKLRTATVLTLSCVVAWATVALVSTQLAAAAVDRTIAPVAPPIPPSSPSPIPCVAAIGLADDLGAAYGRLARLQEAARKNAAEQHPLAAERQSAEADALRVDIAHYWNVYGASRTECLNTKENGVKQ